MPITFQERFAGIRPKQLKLPQLKISNSLTYDINLDLCYISRLAADPGWTPTLTPKEQESIVRQVLGKNPEDPISREDWQDPTVRQELEYANNDPEYAQTLLRGPEQFKGLKTEDIVEPRLEGDLGDVAEAEPAEPAAYRHMLEAPIKEVRPDSWGQLPTVTPEGRLPSGSINVVITRRNPDSGKNEILLTGRNGRSLPQVLPEGREDISQTVKRGIKESTGIDINPKSLSSIRAPGEPGALRAEVSKEYANSAIPNAGARWVPVDEIPTNIPEAKIIQEAGIGRALGDNIETAELAPDQESTIETAEEAPEDVDTAELAPQTETRGEGDLEELKSPPRLSPDPGEPDFEKIIEIAKEIKEEETQEEVDEAKRVPNEIIKLLEKIRDNIKGTYAEKYFADVIDKGLLGPLGPILIGGNPEDFEEIDLLEVENYWSRFSDLAKRLGIKDIPKRPKELPTGARDIYEESKKRKWKPPWEKKSSVDLYKIAVIARA